MTQSTEKTFKRFLEILPGTLTWSVLLFPIIFSFFHPEIAALFIIIYTMLWFFRSLTFSFHLITSFQKAKLYQKYDWLRIMRYFDNNDSNLEKDIQNAQNNKKLLKLLTFIQKRREELKKRGEFKNSNSIKHVVIVATYKESVEILRSSIGSIKNSMYDLKNIIVVLATEERDKENAIQNAEILSREFGNLFGAFYHIMHPKNLPDEIPGKGANISYTGKYLAEKFKSEGKDYSDIIVTTLDADNRLHPCYFANLTFYYLITFERKKRSYQPLPLFYNNIWNVPIINRLTAISSSFWHVIESGRPERLRNFSSHAQSLDALVDMNFWSKKTIVEDGHQFWRAYFCYNGNHRVIPTFMPIYQDAVENVNYFKSIMCQYKQLRRWAWGCSDIPFVIINMIKKRKQIPLLRNITQLWQLIEGHLMWATAPIIITLSPFVPKMFNQAFQKTVVAYNIPIILSYIFSFALGGIFISLWISMFTLPKSPKNWIIKISSVLQWFLFPITTILFGAIPAIEAQTRLLLGNSLDFNVTEKIRKTDPPKNILVHQGTG